STGGLRGIRTCGGLTGDRRAYPTMEDRLLQFRYGEFVGARLGVRPMNDAENRCASGVVKDVATVTDRCPVWRGDRRERDSSLQGQVEGLVDLELGSGMYRAL